MSGWSILHGCLKKLSSIGVCVSASPTNGVYLFWTTVRPVRDERGIYSDTALEHPSLSVIKVTLFLSPQDCAAHRRMHHVRVTLCGLRRIREALSSPWGACTRSHAVDCWEPG
ncbi:hypothetical protein HL42_6208 [Trichophyton rubrum]|nr:hypothetical protein HL42_6208 [Trichophyton rubrum]